MEEENINYKQIEADTLMESLKDYIEDVDDETSEQDLEDEDEDVSVDNNIEEEEDDDDVKSQSRETVEDEDVNYVEDKKSPHKTSSIAKSLKTLGILSTIEDDDISNIKSYSDISKIIDKEVNNRLDKKYRLIDDLMGQDIPVDIIKSYQEQKQTLENIPDQLYDPEKNLEGLKQYVFTDLVERGYPQEDAKDLVDGYVRKGVISDKARQATKNALDRLDANLEEFKKESYRQEEETKKIYTGYINDLQNSILNDDDFFGELQVTKKQRENIIDALLTPSVTSSKSGRLVSEIDDYVESHPVDYNKYFGLFYVLTDGFTNIGKLIKGPVRKGVNKGVRDLANALEHGNARANNDLTYKSGVSSYKDFDFDLSHYTLG